MKKYTVTFEFPNKEIKEEFLGWFLDGGGEYQFNESCECHGLSCVDVTFDNKSTLKIS